MSSTVSISSPPPCYNCRRSQEVQKAQIEEKRKKSTSEYATAVAALHSGSVPAAQSAYEKLQKHVDPSDPLRPAVEQLGIAVQERKDCLAHRRQVAAYSKIQASLHHSAPALDRKA